MSSYELTREIRAEAAKVVLGKDAAIRKVLMAILARGHVLLEDVPGTGKTTLAKTFSRILGLDSKRVQFTSDTLPSDIIGFSVYDREKGELEYKSGAVMTNLLLALCAVDRLRNGETLYHFQISEEDSRGGVLWVAVGMAAAGIAVIAGGKRRKKA